MAERLDLLFAVVPAPQGGDLSSDERVAAELTTAGTTVTADELRRLRSTEATTPDPVLLTATANLFGVPANYFTNDQVAAELELLGRIRHLGVRGVHAHGEPVSPSALAAVLDVLEDLGRVLTSWHTDHR